MQLYPLKLVTVIVEEIVKEQIQEKAMEFGATGFTCFEVSGQGPRGIHSDGFSGAKVRIEFVCPDQVAVNIMTYIAHNYFANYSCIAWMTAVSVVRGVQYLPDKKF